jgi:hypothetical protein
MTPKPTSVTSSSKAAPKTTPAIRAPRIPNPQVHFSMHVGTVLGCLIKTENLNILGHDMTTAHAKYWTALNRGGWGYDPADDGPEVNIILEVRRASLCLNS